MPYDVRPQGAPGSTWGVVVNFELDHGPHRQGTYYHFSQPQMLMLACLSLTDELRSQVIHQTGYGARRLTDLLTRPAGTGETKRDTGDAQRGLRLVSETRWNAGDMGDARRGAHNPEVAGSNPAPATKARGHFSNRERAFCMRFVHRRFKQRLGSFRPAARRARHR